MRLCAHFCRKKSVDRLANAACDQRSLVFAFKHKGETHKPSLVVRAVEVECSSNICSLQMLTTNVPSAVLPIFATFLTRASPHMPARNLNRKYAQANAPQKISRARLVLKSTQMQKIFAKARVQNCVAICACIFVVTASDVCFCLFVVKSATMRQRARAGAAN